MPEWSNRCSVAMHWYLAAPGGGDNWVRDLDTGEWIEIGDSDDIMGDGGLIKSGTLAWVLHSIPAFSDCHTSVRMNDALREWLKEHRPTFR